MDPAFAGTRGLAPNQNIENNPMQSNEVPLNDRLRAVVELTRVIIQSPGTRPVLCI
jgi:hypothetical protein